MRRPFWLHLLVIALYLAVAVLVTWPLVTVMGERILGHPFGDAYEYTHHIWWIHHALQTGQSPFFQPLLLYPDGLAAPWLWGVPFQSFPAWLFLYVMPLPDAFNLQALLTLALNGWAMWVLCSQLLAAFSGQRSANSLQPSAVSSQPSVLSTRHSVLSAHHSSLITHSFFPAFLGGLAFMLYPAFQGQLGAAHTGLLVLWPVVLCVAALLRLRDRATWRGIALAAVLLMLSSWGSVLILIYVFAPFAGLYLVYLAWRREWRTIAITLATIALGAVCSLPFLLPVLREQISQPAAYLDDGSVRYAASALGIVSPSFYHPLYSSIDYPHRVLGIDPFEGAAYVGIVAAALAALALWKRRAARGWLALAALAWVFSLGPLLKLYESAVPVRVAGYATYVSLPWALFQNLPVLNIARTPGRFNFAVGFAVAVMAGYGVAWLLAKLRPRLRLPVVVGLAALIIADYQFFWPLPTIPGDVPAPIAALGDRDDVRAVFDIPWDHPLTDKDGMYLQTGHSLPMIAGHITRQTLLNPAVGNLLQHTLDPALLNAAGADVIILHKQWADEAGETRQFLIARLGEPLYEDDRFAVFEAPQAENTAPSFLFWADAPDTLTDEAHLYVYAPERGTVTLTGEMRSDSPRRARLLLDSTLILEWTVHGQLGLQVPVTLPDAGYHTLTLALDPPCPRVDDPALRCAAVDLSGLALEGYAPSSRAANQ